MEYEIARVEANFNDHLARVDGQLHTLIGTTDRIIGRVDVLEVNTEDLQERIKYYVAEAISGFTKDLLSEIADMFYYHLVKNQIDPMSDEDFYNRVQTLITEKVV